MSSLQYTYLTAKSPSFFSISLLVEVLPIMVLPKGMNSLSNLTLIPTELALTTEITFLMS